MITEKICGVVQGLRALAGQVDEETWLRVKGMCAELCDAARTTLNMERTLLISHTPGDVDAQQRLWADRRHMHTNLRGVTNA